MSHSVGMNRGPLPAALPEELPLLEWHGEDRPARRPFVCIQCLKEFRSRSHLLRHEVIHTGERPYACHLCSSAFNRKESLVLHLRVHTGERPYQCRLCPRRFTSKGNLTQHAFSVHRPGKWC